MLQLINKRPSMDAKAKTAKQWRSKAPGQQTQEPQIKDAASADSVSPKSQKYLTKWTTNTPTITVAFISFIYFFWRVGEQSYCMKTYLQDILYIIFV